VYCHGATLPDGEDTEPSWSSTEDRHCTSCHGAPDTPLHPQSDACEACHGSSYLNEDDEVPDPETHINGVVNLN
jgi:predicted CxxxxCH...CXXCH cytochrome family protein